MKTWEEEFENIFITKRLKNGYVEIGGIENDWDTVDSLKIFIRAKIEEAERRGEERGRSKKQILTTCDRCGKKGFVGRYCGKIICQDCWAKMLSPEDIKNL